MNSPYFSIIIPVFRDTERLALCLDRLKELSRVNFQFEVLVVNNDLENSALDISIQDYPFVIKELFEPIPGSYAARNRGIQEAKGNILAFTDSDCLPDFNWLQTAYEIFEKDEIKEIGILTGPVLLFFRDPNHLSPAELYEKYTGGFTTEAYAKEGRAITANWFSYKSVIQEFGRFNAELKSNGDTELSGKISKKYKIQFSHEVIVYHPARYFTSELVNKYNRLMGGAYDSRFKGNLKKFRIYLFKFLWARYRFALKRLFTLSPRKSIPIFNTCHSINMGVIQEYLDLKNGSSSKR